MLILYCSFYPGICTEEALRATAALRAAGLGVAHLHVSTLKPFTDPLIAQTIAGVRQGVITLENHGIIGGLGSAVAELMAETGQGKRLIRLGLKDTYAHGAGRGWLMREYGLDAMALVRAAEELTGTRFGLTEDALAAVRLETISTADKIEDL